MPNPFNPKTAIAFSLTEPGDVTLEVYDVAGRRVAILLDRHMDAGAHVAHWDGRTSDGERAASGVYFYKLAAGDERTSRKMVLLK
jgi:flagellar hook assembly protein FlgD